MGRTLNPLQMVANPSKFQLMFMGLSKDNKLCLEIDEKIIPSTNQVKLLGITIDAKLKFDTQSLCVSKVTEVLVLFLGLQCIFNNLKKGYCIIRLCQTLNTAPEFECSVEKAPIIRSMRSTDEHCVFLFDDYDAPFADLLVRNNEKTNYVQNLQRLMV